MFADWKAFFKNKMQTEYYNEQEVLVWAKYLTLKKITAREFKIAKSKSFDLEWPANNAKEFLDLVRSFNAEIMRKAYINATNGKYKTGIDYEVGARVGFYELRNHSESKMYPLWKQAYKDVWQESQDGKVFEIPQSRQIEMKPREPLSRNQAMQRMAMLKQQLRKTA